MLLNALLVVGQFINEPNGQHSVQEMVDKILKTAGRNPSAPESNSLKTELTKLLNAPDVDLYGKNLPKTAQLALQDTMTAVQHKAINVKALPKATVQVIPAVAKADGRIQSNVQVKTDAKNTITGTKVSAPETAKPKNAVKSAMDSNTKTSMSFREFFKIKRPEFKKTEFSNKPRKHMKESFLRRMEYMKSHYAKFKQNIKKQQMKEKIQPNKVAADGKAITVAKTSAKPV